MPKKYTDALTGRETKNPVKSTLTGLIIDEAMARTAGIPFIKNVAELEKEIIRGVFILGDNFDSEDIALRYVNGSYVRLRGTGTPMLTHWPKDGEDRSKKIMLHHMHQAGGPSYNAGLNAKNLKSFLKSANAIILLINFSKPDYERELQQNLQDIRSQIAPKVPIILAGTHFQNQNEQTLKALQGKYSTESSFVVSADDNINVTSVIERAIQLSLMPQNVLRYKKLVESYLQSQLARLPKTSTKYSDLETIQKQLKEKDTLSLTVNELKLTLNEIRASVKIHQSTGIYGFFVKLFCNTDSYNALTDIVDDKNELTSTAKFELK